MHALPRRCIVGDVEPVVLIASSVLIGLGICFAFVMGIAAEREERKRPH